VFRVDCLRTLKGESKKSFFNNTIFRQIKPGETVPLKQKTYTFKTNRIVWEDHLIESVGEQA
jgi:hypothetical protein